jgi:DNA-binding NtrC family response regulator
MVSDGRFRTDLLYRINTVEVPVPPLRERADDIPLLATHFLGQYCRRYKKAPRTFHKAALAKLMAYAWPGNVRELQNVIERAVIMVNRDELRPADFQLSPPRASRRFAGSLNLKEVEKATIREALLQNDGNMDGAAEVLGISRSALYRKARGHGL